MSESYVQIPDDDVGKKLKTWSDGTSHAEAVVLTIADASNSFIDPRMINITGSDVTLAVTGSFNATIDNPLGVTGSIQGATDVLVYITGSSATFAVTGSASITSGNIGVTGSVTVSPVVSGSGVYTYASAQMITGSINLNSSSAITGSINNWPSSYTVTPTVSGSGIYTQLSAVMVTGSININSGSALTGSINNWPTNYAISPVVSGSGVYTQLSAVMITGSINLNSSSAISGSVMNWPAVYTASLSGSWKDSISTGASVALLTVNSGSKLVSSGSGLKIKLFDLGYTMAGAGLHFAYFGTTTGSLQTRLVLASSGSGTFRQTFVYPRVSNASDALFLLSTVAETGVYWDCSYIQE